MIIAQKEIRRGIEEAVGMSHNGKYPDFLFCRGDPWGVCIRPPGIRIHHANGGEKK